MCIFEDCRYNCLTKKQHHARYANMRRKKPMEKIDEDDIKLSSKINWSIALELNVDKSVKRYKIVNDNVNDEEILKDIN